MTQALLKKPANSIAFIDLKAQQSVIEAPIKQAIDKVLGHGQYIMGPEVISLEKDLCHFTGANHTISCASGTDALVMGLMALDVKAGQGVLVPSFTFASTAESVALLGAIPIFVDADPRSYNISIDSLEDAYHVAKKQNIDPVGIISVDLFGLPADYDTLHAFAKTHDLWLMDDAAQSLGGVYKNKKIGQLADITTTSFFPAKPLGCYGDGGAIFTDSDDLATKLRSIRVHGKGDNKYDNVRLGLNGRIDTMQAAILIEKLAIFPEEIKKRQAVAKRYNQELASHIQVPIIDLNFSCVWAQYTLQAPNNARGLIQDYLKNCGVPTAVYYPLPLHQQTYYKSFPAASDMSTCEDLSQKVFSLPMHPYLETDTQDYIIDCVKQAIANT